MERSALDRLDFIQVTRVPDSAARLLIVLFFLALSYTTWARWGDLRIDCGREMYVPAEIAAGKMLYRDLWYPYGPLAPYWNALLFRLFGSKLVVLYGSGLSITLAFSLLLYALGRRFVGPLAASVVVIGFLIQAFRSGLFSFVLPYAYPATLGSLFSLLCVYWLVRHARGEGGPNLIAAGVVAGLALLCKQEFGAACYATVGLALALDALGRRSLSVLVKGSVQMLPGIVLSAAGYGWFAWVLSPSFLLLENFHITPQSAFMREFGGRWLESHGLRFAPGELFALWVGLALSVGFWCLIAWAMGRIDRRWVRFLLAGVFLVCLLILAMSRLRALLISILLYPTGMYWAVPPLLVAALLGWRKDRFKGPPPALAVLALFGLAVGARVLAEVLPFGYSIYYSPVLFLLLIILLIEATRRAASGRPAVREAIVCTVLVLEAIGLVVAVHPGLERDAVPLSTERGIIYARPSEAATFPGVIAFIREQQAMGKKVAILPEETSLYFLTGTQAPARWYALTPGVLHSPALEREYIAALDRQKVDYVLLSNRTTKEYGLPFFGFDYNQAVYQWLTSHYEVIGEFGKFSREEPFRFGMLIYRRTAYKID